MKIDFVLAFTTGFRVAIELDGLQHFFPVPWCQQTEAKFESATERDLAKEDALLANGIPVVRVLQQDVWSNRYNWKAWIIKVVDKAKAEAEANEPPRVHLPVRKEYRYGVYKNLRQDRDQTLYAWEEDEREGGISMIDFCS